MEESPRPHPPHPKQLFYQTNKNKMTTAKGNIRTTDTIQHQVPAGGCMTITPACGLGKAMVANLDKVVATYKRQLIVDQGPAKELALQANAARRAARDAQAALDLDALLATI